MAYTVFTQPFIRSFTHATVSVGTASGTYLDAAITPIRRVKVIVQNQHATAVITVRFAETGSEGIQLKSGESITHDNYNGHIRIMSTVAATPVHIAYATC